MAEPLVLDDRRVTYPLVFLEDAVGKRVPFPAHLKRSIREVVKLNILTAELFRHLVPLHDDLLRATLWVRSMCVHRLTKQPLTSLMAAFAFM